MWWVRRQIGQHGFVAQMSWEKGGFKVEGLALENGDSQEEKTGLCMFNSSNIQHWSFSAISSFLLKSLNVLCARQGVCIVCVHGPKRQSPTDYHTQGRCFGQKLPFPNFQQRFPPTSQAARFSNKQGNKSTHTHTHPCVSVYVYIAAKTHPLAFLVDTSFSKVQNSHWPIQESKV